MTVRPRKRKNETIPRIFVVLVIFILVSSAIVTHLFMMDGSATHYSSFTDKSGQIPKLKYNITSSEWIDEFYQMQFMTLLEIHTQITFDVHKISILNITGASAQDLRTLYAKNSTEVISALNKSAELMSNLALNSTFSQLAWTVSETSVQINLSSLAIQPTIDKYNPPVEITGYFRLDIAPDTFQFTNFTSDQTSDILLGFLRMGAEIKLPMGYYCSAGHNQTITNYPPPGVIFGDGMNYYPDGPLIWQCNNFQGSTPITKSETLAIIATNRTIYQTSKIDIGVLFKFDNITFLTDGDTQFNISVNVAANLYRIVVDQRIQKWYSKYLMLNYINVDFLRLIRKMGIIDENQLNGYLNVINQTLFSEILGAFPYISNLTYNINLKGFDAPFNVTNLKDTPPISLYVNTSFQYLYHPGNPLKSVTGIRILAIKRTYIATLPGPMAAGYNFMGDGMLNYTFQTPQNVIIYDVTANGKEISTFKSSEGYVFTVSYASSDGNKTIRVLFGAEVDYDIEALIPYIMLVLSLVVIWVVLFVAGRKKQKNEELEKKERLARGELLEDEEE